MLTEDISTDIAQLEEEIEQLRRDFKEKVGVIESRITYIKKQLPKDNKRKSGIVMTHSRELPYHIFANFSKIKYFY